MSVSRQADQFYSALVDLAIAKGIQSGIREATFAYWNVRKLFIGAQHQKETALMLMEGIRDLPAQLIALMDPEDENDEIRDAIMDLPGKLMSILSGLITFRVAPIAT